MEVSLQRTKELHLYFRLLPKAHNLVLLSGFPFFKPAFYLLVCIPAFPKLSSA